MTDISTQRVIGFFRDVLWQQIGGAAILSIISSRRELDTRLLDKFLDTLKEPILWLTVLGFNGYTHFFRGQLPLTPGNLRQEESHTPDTQRVATHRFEEKVKAERARIADSRSVR